MLSTRFRSPVTSLLARVKCRVYLAWAIVIPAMMLSCIPEDHVGSLGLTNGMSVADVTLEGDCTTVLLLTPQECITCDGLLENWMAARRTVSFELVLLLTGEPNATQVEALRIRRAPLAGVLADSMVRAEPTAYLFEGRDLVDSIVGVGQQISFLRALQPLPVASQQRCSWSEYTG